MTQFPGVIVYFSWSVYFHVQFQRKTYNRSIIKLYIIYVYVNVNCLTRRCTPRTHTKYSHKPLHSYRLHIFYTLVGHVLHSTQVLIICVQDFILCNAITITRSRHQVSSPALLCMSIFPRRILLQVIKKKKSRRRIEIETITE